MAKKLLIIKLGYTETLDNSLSLTTSLGDVLRTTFILHFFKGYQVSWLVDERAAPLLEKNKYIDRILVYSPGTPNQLSKENFDVVVNFEKLPEFCSLAHSLKSKKRFGFGLNGLDKDVRKHPKESKRLVRLSRDVNERRKNKDYWQVILAEALGKKWRGEEYILGYVSEARPIHDIGFNWAASSKWNNKIWPKSYWRNLESLLRDNFSISWQQGLSSLYEYIDWINSCRLIVTADSLGLHLCLALQKKVVALFGPTSHREIYFYGCGSYILPESPYDCVPCLKAACDKKRQCLEYISPQRVKKIIQDEFEKNMPSQKL